MPTEFKNNIELVRAVGAAVSRAVDRYTIGLLLYNEDNTGVDIGSGVGIRVGTRNLVATAAHNLTRDPKKIALVHQWHANNIWTPIVAYGGRGGDLHDNLDIGWLELAPDAELKDKKFLPLDKVRGKLNSAKRYFVHGFPTSRAEIQETTPRKTIALTAVGCFTVLHPEHVGNPDHDIFLQYGKDAFKIEDGAPEMVDDAPGLSGCGIWEIHLQAGRLWTPGHCRLVGINRSWRRGDYVRGTLIDRWVDMVRDDRPELF